MARFINLPALMFRIVTVACALALCFVGRGAEVSFDFTTDNVNHAPPGFRSTVSGTGPVGDWKVVLDDVPTALPAFSPKSPIVNKRPVLAQLSRDKTDERYPMLIYEGDSFGDFTVSTQIKMVEGDVERMAGIAFRIQDEKNYYYIRANAVDNNIYFFKWVNGALYGPIGSKIEVAAGVWHDLVVECRGNEIRCRFNGKEAFPALQDNSFSSGRIALWTKSDSVSYFGSTRINYTPRERFAQTILREALEKYDRLVGLTVFAAGTNGPVPQALASKDTNEIGTPAPPAEQDVLARSTIYHLKSSGRVTVVLPMRDNNGETIAAVRVVMKALPGQTEKNAISRAMPVVRYMESRLQRAAELFQ
jgi:hypothetical protein